MLLSGTVTVLFAALAFALSLRLEKEQLVHGTLTSWIVLACGLCGAVLVVSYGLRELLRSRRVDLLVAERTRDLAEANAELRKLSRAVEQSPISILVTDKDGKIEYVNPRFTEVTGRTLEEARGKYPGMLSDQAVPTEECRRCREAILSGGEWRGELQSARKNGEPCWEALCISPITDSRGAITNFIVLKADVTERKRAESELQQAKETAEAAARLKSEFLANVSHEIRTPMGAVLGMADLLLNTNLDSEQREYVESIRTCSEALIAVISDILDFSKMEAGKLELEHEPLDAAEAVEECLEMVAPQASEKGLELACNIGEGTPSTVLGDITRLRQILTNLLSNAVKFTDSGEIIVTVECPAAERQGSGKGGLQELHFVVKDTGVGISEAQQARLFKPFGQADASTARRYGGTGLGLVIARRLSEIMGGTLWLESEEHKGSAFHFTILAEQVATSQRSHLRGPQPQFAGKRVLVVDDNATVRQAICSLVGSWGMFPSAFASGREALDGVEQGDPFDFALLDVQMPDMDGLELAAEIRKRRGPDVLPLVMMTSVGLRGEKLKSARINCQAIVTKPLRLGRLYEALMGVFGGQDAREAGSPSRWTAIPRIAERHPLRVLLAEDNPMNQKLVLRLLEKMGYKADLARDGLQVLEALAERPYDVILMDVQMPELDGLEVTRRIRTALPEEARPRIVAMTAAALPADREACRQAGMDDYLAKPLKVEDLVAVLATSVPRGSCRA